MTTFQPIPQKLHLMPIISHIKVPSFELNSQGNEVIKAKRLFVNPPQGKIRSSSAQSRFRTIFKTPRPGESSKSKENFSKLSGYLKDINTSVQPSSNRRVPQPPIEGKQINVICMKIEKDNELIRNKLVEQERVLKDLRNGFEEGRRVCVPRINIEAYRGIAVRAFAQKENVEDLVTFRPNYTPGKKQFRFPREIFSNETKRKL